MCAEESLAYSLLDSLQVNLGIIWQDVAELLFASYISDCLHLSLLYHFHSHCLRPHLLCPHYLVVANPLQHHPHYLAIVNPPHYSVVVNYLLHYCCSPVWTSLSSLILYYSYALRAVFHALCHLCSPH